MVDGDDVDNGQAGGGQSELETWASVNGEIWASVNGETWVSEERVTKIGVNERMNKKKKQVVLVNKKKKFSFKL